MGRIELLRDRHRGARCVLVANGPSLNRMDLSFLRHELAIGLNKIFLGLRSFNFYPRYYVAVNPKVVEQSQVEIRQLNCVKFIGRTAAAGRIEEDALTYLVDTASPPARFSRDPAQGVHEGWSVTHVALQLAHFLGFSEVVLIGLDHRYQFSGAANETRILEGPDPNHFSEAYFGHGQQWDNPDLVRAEESFRVARAEFERDGRRILDATLDGACAVFEKVDYRKLFCR